MRIVVVASLAYSLVNFRGRLLADMIAAGHQVTAYAPDNDAETAAALCRLGVAVRRMPMSRTGLNPLHDLATLAWLTRWIAADRADLVLAYTQKPIVYAGLACRLLRRPTFFAMVSGLGHAFSGEDGRWVRAIVARLYRHALKRVAGVFVFNADDHGELLRNRMIAERTTVIQVPGSGVDIHAFKPSLVLTIPLRFVMITRLLRNKGLFEFVEAARRVRRDHPTVEFELIGPTDPNPAGVPLQQIEAWEAEGCIRYAGETRDVRPHLARAGVFVLPSWYREGLPRTILEAMASGRAVITTDMPGCREPIVDGENGFLVRPRDASSLEAALRRFIDDPELAVRMGERARATAVAHYAVERVNAILLSAMQLRPAAEIERSHVTSGHPAALSAA